MSKSLGNTLQVTEMVKHVRAVELRYYLGSAHYRSVMEYSPDALAEAGAAYRRIENFVERATRVVDDAEPSIVCAEFAAALDNDLSVPGALAAIHNVVREGNAALAEARHDAVRDALSSVLAMTEVLGVNPLRWVDERAADLTSVVDSLVHVALDQRAAARARKDYAAADSIRDELTRAGIVVEDTADGPRWTLKDAP
jgi:cysteinyl-tRNA synthetase